jgi:hypothetical protein
MGKTWTRNPLAISMWIIRCEAVDPLRQLHIDFADCLLMGCGVFGTRKGEPSYSITGKIQAYVQFQQPTPAGFKRVGLWPVEVLSWLIPPQPD